MTFWQENFSFIKDVYDSRSSKLIELMDKTDKAMAAVLADKIYTSNEFKKVKETFTVRTARVDVFLLIYLEPFCKKNPVIVFRPLIKSN